MKPYYERGGITIYHGDCREILPQLKAVDLVLTDPPYGTGGWRKVKGTPSRKLRPIAVREEWDEGDTDWLRFGSYPVITFWPPARTLQLLEAAQQSGRAKHRMLAMYKSDAMPMPGNRVRWTMEPIWVLSLDGFVLIGGDDVYQASTHGLLDHQYEKPLKVMAWILEKVPDAALILDPFMGSGTTLRAAKDLGRRATGIEIEEKYCEIAVKRLAQEVLL